MSWMHILKELAKDYSSYVSRHGRNEIMLKMTTPTNRM
jgi:hypothetical protein